MIGQLVKQLAGDARIVFDVGAAEGRVAGAYLDLFPNAVVYAFEPTPGLCKLKSRPRLKVIHAAVMDKSGEVQFHLNTDSHTNSILPFVPTFEMARTKQVITVSAVSLDDFCAEHKISRVDLIKIDVQGAELQVLRGAAGLFAREAVGVVVVELQHAVVYKGQSKRGEVGKFLSHYGFSLKQEFPTYRGDNLIHSNGVFAR